MLDRDIESIRDLIFYQYAKIIARRAFSSTDGKEAKRRNYGFIKKTFHELKTGEKSWSEITREDWQFVESGKKCIYCGADGELHREHIVPSSIRIKQECGACDKIQSIHSQIWACRSYNSSKGNSGLYEFYRRKSPSEKKFYDSSRLFLKRNI